VRVVAPGQGLPAKADDAKGAARKS